MQKSTIKKISFLGLVLMGASAVVAAVIPTKNNDEDRQLNGKLQFSSNAADTAKTCITKPSVAIADCDRTQTVNDNLSLGSSTSDAGTNSVTINGNQTGTATTGA